MSQEAVERVLGRLITDERFRLSVGDSLETACVQQGYSLSRLELRFLSELELKQISPLQPASILGFVVQTPLP